MATETDKLNQVDAAHTACAIALEGLSRLVFTPECKLTLLMRHPDNDDCNMLVTDDSIDDIVSTLRKMQAEEKGGQT